MSTVAIDIPDEVLESLTASPAELAEQIRLASAIHWYKAGKISREVASSLAGMQPERFMQATNDGEPSIIPPKITNEEERVKAIRDGLAALHKSGAFAEIEDPVAWQREIRKDRPLPGRD